MSKTFEEGKEEIIKLCRYFETNRKVFLESGVKEAHIRQTLIDPFFEALGWDVANKRMVAPQFREVIPEDSLDIEGHQKSPDYVFRVGTLPKFYVEAKKCGVNISSDSAPAYQLRRYGWSAKVPLSILFNFEELSVYDCTRRPNPADKASHSRILHFRFEEYAGRFGELWEIFSREAIWSGRFDQYADSKRKRGTTEVDVEFLKEIEGWRDLLAKNIALRNKDVSSEDLNSAVQMTIDRIVFLRMAEDRGLEPFEQLLKLSEQPDIYSRFIRGLCLKADRKYNSGLFHFKEEREIPDPPDKITPKLTIDDAVLKHIIQSLYFAYGSPYHFGVLPVEILGAIYERFLGKVIRLTAGHQAKVEEKPEVRKAGGVYYTPTYIIEYIVKRTIGKWVNGKSPAQLSGSKTNEPLRVLDMACGSGSFLLGAYSFLLNHYLNWYVEHQPARHKRAIYKDPHNGQWRLTIEEKKRILTTHIFGVDIDPQATEVTKLSLLLKVLEGETDQSFQLGLLPFSDRALPNLAANIKCGNSLIGAEYFAGKLVSSPEELKRINAFDWEKEFPEAMKAGGFDCIIGNPPYVRIQTLKEWAPLEVEIYKEIFRASKSGNYDIYVAFLERGLKMLNSKGLLGFICPNKFFNAKYGEAIRSLISEGRHLSHAVNFGDEQVFEGAAAYTSLIFLNKAGSDRCNYVKVENLNAWKALFANGENGEEEAPWGAEGVIPSSQITGAEWNFHVGNGVALFKKLNRMPIKLGKIAHIFVGTQTSAEDIFVLDNCKKKRKYTLGTSRKTGEIVKVETACVKPFLKGKEIRRYVPPHSTSFLICPYYIKQDACILIPEEEAKRKYPLVWVYFKNHKKDLAGREKGRFKRKGWYAFGYPKSMSLFEKPKIIVPDYNNVPSFTFDDKGFFYKTGYGIIPKDVEINFYYLLGLLNSKLLFWHLKRVSTFLRGGYIRFWTQFIEKLPIRRIDFSNKQEKAKHDRMVKLVEGILELHKQLSEVTSNSQRIILERQIEATDREIDKLVYDLYGLTAKEIEVVETTKTR